MPEPLWIFMHLPKSGGTTVSAHLVRHLAMDEDFIEFSNWGDVYRRENDRLPFPDRPVADRQKARVLAGHKVNYGVHLLCPQREPRYLTAVREPAERCVSSFNFQRSRGHAPDDFWQWYETNYRVNQRSSAVRFFAERYVRRPVDGHDADEMLEMTKTLLGRFWMVTTTSQLDSLLAALSRALGIPLDWKNQRVAGQSGALHLPSHPFQGEKIYKHMKVSEQISAAIYDDFPEDRALYQWIETTCWEPAD